MSLDTTRSIRNTNDKYTQLHENNEINDPSVIYNGSIPPYEDPADYIRRGATIKAVRLA
jgi:hypothetical protein